MFGLNQRSLSVLFKVISRNRKMLNEYQMRVFQLDVNIEKYRYSHGLKLNLILTKHVEPVKHKISLFFRLAAKHLQSELMDIFLTSPESLNSICKTIPPFLNEFNPIFRQTLED